MTELSDFVVVVDNRPINIGDSRPVWEASFVTGGRTGREAVIFVNVRGLTHTGREAIVRVNGYEAGRLSPYPGESETSRAWYTQILSLEAYKLKHEGANEMQIEAVRLDAEDTTAWNVFDDFQVRNIVVLFHQKD